MEVVSCSHSCSALRQTPQRAWRLRGSGVGLGHAKSPGPRRSAIRCVGTTRGTSVPGDSSKVHATQGFVDATLQGVPSRKVGEIEKVMIQGLPEGPDSSPISTGFWEWKPKLTVYYERSGTKNSKAPAVLFLPGFGVGTFHFEKQLRDLGRDHKVWTMDFLGQGMSLPCEDPAPSSIAGDQNEDSFWGFGEDSQPWAEELVYSVDLWQNQVQHFIEEVLLEFSIVSYKVCFSQMSFMFSWKILACLLKTPHRPVTSYYFFPYSHISELEHCLNFFSSCADMLLNRVNTCIFYRWKWNNCLFFCSKLHMQGLSFIDGWFNYILLCTTEKLLRAFL